MRYNIVVDKSDILVVDELGIIRSKGKTYESAMGRALVADYRRSREKEFAGSFFRMKDKVGKNAR